MPGRHKSVAEEQHNLMPGVHTAARHRSDTGHRASQALHRARRRAGVQPSYLLQAHVRGERITPEVAHRERRIPLTSAHPKGETDAHISQRGSAHTRMSLWGPSGF